MSYIDPNDYIAAYTHVSAMDPTKAALVLVDMQYATGSRRGALGLKHSSSGARGAGLDYRFTRLEQTVVPAQQALLKAFRAAGSRVIYIRNGARRPDALDAPLHMRSLYRELGVYVGSDQHRVLDELEPREGDLFVDKSTIGAFASTGIDSMLRALGIEQLAIGGISTNMCVETTAREAADRGYRVTLMEDACATTHRELHDTTLRNFARLFGRVCASATVLEEFGAAVQREA